ncbi:MULTISPECIES: hypothetical protein [Mycobacterium ulcerans group]|uniref:hypothetical protein n=1 Tax=Mycobacterium ulcerans group TaxID=2993898 RepID=UPI000358E19E|nr:MULTISPECIES: hypothetical protein [Mycobacterium ulcerans group]EPQ49138.1 hypothetical protein MMSP_4899 [Mycobacterium sp. 012931]MBC9860787.1 hypothetical protein [Mycobacterium pseudoshottsii]RFZ59080.1 hypothetical protein DL240490_04476 [Mycobacterium marinum]GAQ35424.1 hypothetical protein MPS_2635 [Mycobacterium pseudoshottsii JCM 15466]RFZ67437.1 hypothetical protein BB170200_00979 [Mycobacterium marinum]
MLSQAVAASSIGADPAPVNIRNELTSGGNIAKFVMVGPCPYRLLLWRRPGRRGIAIRQEC